jgi:cobalt-zinc-cadmium efflux system outer membrane protein
MLVRLRAWLTWSATLLLLLAGCRAPCTLPPGCIRTGEDAPKPLRASTAFNMAPLQHWAEAVNVPDDPPGADEGPGQESPQEQPRQQAPEKRRPLGERLELPADLPGSDAPAITLPDLKPGNEQARKEAIDRQFPALPALPELPQLPPGPDGKPVSLVTLEQMALESSPVIRQASAAVDAARGVALQAGLCPNPRVGYQGDAINESSTAGQQGAFIEQTFKTGKKLQVARSAAEVDVTNAELALRRTGIDLRTQVRRHYFAVLAAERSLRVARAFAALTTEVYDIQVTRLRLGQAASYEPLQARVLARQARAVVLQAQNRQVAAWRQLTATLGRPDLAPVALADDLDRPVPHFVAEEVLPRVLREHPDVLTAENGVNKAKLQMRLAEVTPIPDIDLRYQVQYDKTSLPNNAMHGVSVGVQLPVWNRNQGNQLEAGANLSRAGDEPERVRNNLLARVAAALERYNNARQLVLLYRDQIVPDQARAYRNIYRGYDTALETLHFNDVVTAQQTLADTIQKYIGALTNLWASVADIANLLQMDDLFGTTCCKPDAEDNCPLPEMVPVRDMLPPPAEVAPVPPAQAPTSRGTRVPFSLRQIVGLQPDSAPETKDN